MQKQTAEVGSLLSLGLGRTYIYMYMSPFIWSGNEAFGCASSSREKELSSTVVRMEKQSSQDNGEIVSELMPDTSTESSLDKKAGDDAELKTEPPRSKSLKFKLTVFFLAVVTLIASMDAVIVGSCLAAIAKDLQSSSVESFWVGTSFLLAQTVTIPPYGTTSEIFGRKGPILIATAIFTVGSVLCATAQNVRWLIGARVVQGIGAGGMVQLVQVILSDISTMSERGLYMAIAALAWSLGTNMGIPLGGAIGSRTTWRWVFYINIPTCVVCIVGLIYSLQLQQDISSFRKKLAKLDWTGLGVFTCASTLFLVGVTSGGTLHPWNSAAVLVPLILGSLVFGVFLFTQWRIASNPMMPLRIFNDRSAIVGFATSFLHGLVFWCVTYYMIIFVCLPPSARRLQLPANTHFATSIVPRSITAWRLACLPRDDDLHRILGARGTRGQYAGETNAAIQVHRRGGMGSTGGRNG